MERLKNARQMTKFVTPIAICLRFLRSATILVMGMAVVIFCVPKLAHGQVTIQGTYDITFDPQPVTPNMTVNINPCSSNTGRTGTGTCSWPPTSESWPEPSFEFCVEAPYNTTAYNVSWTMNTDYVDTHYGAAGYHNTTSQSKTLSGNSCFFPATSDDQPYGGSVIVQAVARPANSCSGGVTGTLSFDIWGVNQNNEAQLKPAAENYNSSILNGAGWFLPYLIGRESRDVNAGVTGVQFKLSNGHPLWGSPDGRGVMQVDRYKHPTDFID